MLLVPPNPRPPLLVGTPAPSSCEFGGPFFRAALGPIGASPTPKPQEGHVGASGDTKLVWWHLYSRVLHCIRLKLVSRSSPCKTPTPSYPASFTRLLPRATPLKPREQDHISGSVSRKSRLSPGFLIFPFLPSFLPSFTNSFFLTF